MLNQKIKILTCFCPDCQILNANQLYYILIQNIVTILFQSLNLSREHTTPKHDAQLLFKHAQRTDKREM